MHEQDPGKTCCMDGFTKNTEAKVIWKKVPRQIVTFDYMSCHLHVHAYIMDLRLVIKYTDLAVITYTCMHE